MKILRFKYFFPTDNLFIQTSEKKSPIGTDDFQYDVVLFREDKTNDIVGIDISHFMEFDEDRIQISKEEAIDFQREFKVLRELIKLQKDIINQQDQDMVFPHYSLEKSSPKAVTPSRHLAISPSRHRSEGAVILG